MSSSSVFFLLSRAAGCSLLVLFVLRDICATSMDILQIQEMALLSFGKFLDFDFGPLS